MGEGQIGCKALWRIISTMSHRETPLPHPTLRIAEPADASEIARLNALFNDVHQPPEFYAARMGEAQRADTPILAEIDGCVVGMVNLRLVKQVFYPEPYAELTELFVEEAYRRRGVARALIESAEELARAAGAPEMLILTDFYNHPAQMLYGALGYVHHDIVVSKKLS